MPISEQRRAAHRTSMSWKSVVNRLKNITSSTPKSPQPSLGRRNSSGSTSTRRTDQPGRLAKLDLLDSPSTLEGDASKELPAHLQRVERWRNSSVPVMIFPTTRNPEVRSSPPYQTRFQTYGNGAETFDSEDPTASSGRLARTQGTASLHRLPTSDMDGRGDSDAAALMRSRLLPFERSARTSSTEAYSRPMEGRPLEGRLTHITDSHGANGYTQVLGRPNCQPQVPRTATAQRPSGRPNLSIIIPD